MVAWNARTFGHSISVGSNSGSGLYSMEPWTSNWSSPSLCGEPSSELAWLPMDETDLSDTDLGVIDLDLDAIDADFRDELAEDFADDKGESMLIGSCSSVVNFIFHPGRLLYPIPYLEYFLK